ncbi:MAG: ribosome maturation factor RimM [Actinomycetota bacterium]
MTIGRLGRPHGVHGAVHARPSGPTLATLAPGARLVARDAGRSVELVLVERGGTDQRPVLRFAGVEDRDGAHALAGMHVAVPAAELPPIDDADTFYVRELVGCEVFAGDRPLGRVVEVHEGPANDALEVAREGGSILLPFTADALVELDVPGRRIAVRPDLLPREDEA